MRRIRLGALVLALGLCATPALRAQQLERPSEGFRFGLGIGATLPMGDFGDSDKLGLNLLGIFQTPLGQSPLYLRVDGLYSSTAHEVGSGTTSILGGTASALYYFSAPAATTRPYALGGLGFFNVDPGANAETKIGFGFGGGLLFNLAGFNAFAEARYVSVQTSGFSRTFIPVTVGMVFGY